MVRVVGMNPTGEYLYQHDATADDWYGTPEVTGQDIKEAVEEPSPLLPVKFLKGKSLLGKEDKDE